MCGGIKRYHDIEQVAHIFQATIPFTSGDALAPVGEHLRSGSPLIAVVQKTNRVLSILKWGIPARPDSAPLVNARYETIHVRPTWQPLIGNRCIIPVDGFLEESTWLSSYNKDEMLALAGIYTGRQQVVILTQPADEGIRHIHDRMPLILPADLWQKWIDPAFGKRSFSTDLWALAREAGRYEIPLVA